MISVRAYIRFESPVTMVERTRDVGSKGERRFYATQSPQSKQNLNRHCLHGPAPWHSGERAALERSGCCRITQAVCGFIATIIHEVPNLSLSWPKRLAKNVSSIGMKICPPSDSSPQMRSASAAVSSVSERYTLRIG